jgi:hypothetical protein
VVTRIVVFLTLVSLFLTACGGDSESSSSSPTRSPSTAAAPTSTPSGPRAVVEPSAGPPGIEITVRGSGWEPGVPIDVTGELEPGASADPYETVVTGADGSFTARFRLETTPDGAMLDTGRYNLIARSAAGQVTIPFLVETRRPIGSSGPSG